MNTVTQNPSESNLVAQIEWLLSRLPRVNEHTSRREADYYGASALIAESLGLSLPPLSRSSWFHGWQPTKLWESHPDLDPRAVFGDRDPNGVNLVLTEGQAEYMRGHGWSCAEACGAPFLWASESGLPRVPGSLLVAPPHVTDVTEQDWDESEYVDQIQSIRSDFSTVVACVSGPCVAKGYWVKSFERAGIPWIQGASVRDRNALLRMRAMFDSFEYLTTPKLGSHVPYAAYSGCKVSMWGIDMPYRREQFQKDQMRQRYPEGLEKGLEEGTREKHQQRYPFLFCDPREARSQTVWAAHELGEDHKRVPLEMTRLLGWRWSEGWDDARTRRYLHSASGEVGKALFLAEEKIKQWLGR